MKERIQKLLANAGVASRRNIEEMVLQGRISVNGRVMTELPILIDPGRDRVTVDGEPIKLAAVSSSQRLYFLLNKPKGVYSTNVAQGAQKLAIDLLPPDLPGRVYPVGRLDAESKGLLLLTNDGELTNRLTHPRYGVAKTYRATVDGSVQPKTLVQLEKGVWMADEQGKGFKAAAGQVRISHRERDKTILDITIREGRNLQVRRLLAKFGHKVRDLTRIRFGPLTLEGLPAGKFRTLTTREIKQLHQVAEGKEKGAPQADRGKKRGPAAPTKGRAHPARGKQRGNFKGK